MKVRAQAGISLTALLSIVLGLAVLLSMGLGVSKYFSASEEKYEEQLPSVLASIHEISGKSSGESIKDTLRLGQNGLWLFFNKGNDPITLQYKTDTDTKFGDYIINRPEECSDSACVCYCKDNSFWKEIEEVPYLTSTLVVAGTPYSCPLTSCQVIQEDLMFVNSRGSEEYYKAVQKKIDEDKQGKSYTPISFDIITLTQPKLLLSVVPGRKNIGNIFFSTATKDNNPFTNYHIAFQQSSVVKYLLQDYSWKGGFALGGYGAALSESQRKAHQLTTSPVTLTFENWGDGIIGVCPYEKCLFETELKDLQEVRQQEKIHEELTKRYNLLLQKLNNAPSCVVALPANSLSLDCKPLGEIYSLFSLKDVSLINPTLTFTLGQSKGDVPTTITKVTLEDDYSRQNKNVVFGSVETFFIFTCLVDNKPLVDRDLSLFSLIKEGTYSKSPYDNCVLNILDTYPISDETCDEESCPA